MGYFTPIKIELTDDWVTPEEYHARQKPAQEEEDKGSNLGRGLKSGVLSTLAIPPALASMGVKTLGLQGAAEWSAEKASGLLEKASEYQPDTSFKELVSDPSWEGALDWGLYTIGNIAPSMIVGMGGAGLGGKIAAKVFLKKAIKKEALKGLTLKKATETAVKKIVGAGQKTGLVASTGAMEGGHMYMTDVEKHGVEGARVAPHLLAGTVAGLIELGLGGAEISMINKYLGKGAAKIASKDPSAGVKMLNKIWQVAKVPAGEATQELLQEEVAMLDELFVAKPGEEVTTPLSKEGLWRGAESAASGLMGGVPGAAGVVATPVRKGIAKGIEDRAKRDEGITETEDVMADISARLNDPEDDVVNIDTVLKEYQRLADDENMVNERAAIGNMAFNYIVENKVDDAVKADIVKKLGDGDPLSAKLQETISEPETVLVEPEVAEVEKTVKTPEPDLSEEAVAKQLAENKAAREAKEAEEKAEKKQRTIKQIEADIVKRQEASKKHAYKAGDVRKSQLAHELSVLYHEMEIAAKAEAGKRAAPERGIKGKDEPFKLPETLKNKVVYNGIQEGFGKIPARHTFTDKNTGSTFLIGLDETDIESKVNERLDELDADFKEKEVVEPQAEKIKDVETKEILPTELKNLAKKAQATNKEEFLNAFESELNSKKLSKRAEAQKIDAYLKLHMKMKPAEFFDKYGQEEATEQIPKSPDGRYQISKKQLSSQSGAKGVRYIYPHGDNMGVYKEGDSRASFNTLEEAIAGAEEDRKLDDSNKIFRDKQDAEDKIEKEKADKVEAERQDIDGFGDELSPMRKGKIVKTLNKEFKFNGKIMSVKDKVKAMLEDPSFELETHQEDRIKPMSRRAYNRATGSEQEAHERRMKEAGQKTVYSIRTKKGEDQFSLNIGKTAYDYAQHLVDKKGTSKAKVAPASKLQKNQFYVRERDGSLFKKEGKPIKIKGFGEYKFFYSKVGNAFNISEVSTGTLISSKNTLKEAKVRAYEMLSKNKKEFDLSIKKKKITDKEIAGFEAENNDINVEISDQKNKNEGIAKTEIEDFIPDKAESKSVETDKTETKPTKTDKAESLFQIGDKVKFTPNKKNEIPTEGILRDIIKNDSGGTGYHIYVPETGYTDRVWVSNGKLEKQEPVKTVENELQNFGLKVNKSTDSSGNDIYLLTGNTFAHKEDIKTTKLAKWQPQKKAWGFYEKEGLNRLANKLIGDKTFDERSESDKESSKPASEEKTDGKRLQETTGTNISGRTKSLIAKGVDYGIPEKIINEQVEDIKKIFTAFNNKKKVFILGNEAGTGKTFVIGGFLREALSSGDKIVTYVTTNQNLISQIKQDLKDFKVADKINFITYAKMREGVKAGHNDIIVFDEGHNIKNITTKQGIVGKKLIQNSDFVLLASATPFENPTEAGYLGATGVFKPAGGFYAWAKKFGASTRTVPTSHGDKEILVWEGSTEDTIAANKWLKDHGLMISRDMQIPSNMVETSFKTVSVDPKWVKLFNTVTNALEEKAAAVNNKMKFMLGGQRTGLQKRILEASKIDAGIELAKKEIADGSQVVIFVETKAKKQKKFQDVINDPKATGVSKVVARALLGAGINEINIPAAETKIKKAFGLKNTAIYTGSISDKKAQENLQDWRNKKKQVLVVTMDKGGTGLSLHDLIGDRPTTQININLPWKGTKVAQVSGRIARYGLKSKAKVYWLRTDDISFDAELNERVAKRVADMGGIVKGGTGKNVFTKDDIKFETSGKGKTRSLTRADIKKAFSKMSNVATGIDKQGNFWFRFKGFPRFTIHEMDSINDRVGITDERQRTGAFLDKSKQLWFKTGGVGAQADIGSLYHEQFHLLRKFGVVSRADTNAIKRAIRRGGHKGTITEETEASWIGDAAKSREYARDTVIGRIIQKIGDFIDSMVNLLLTTSRGVSRKMESGKMAEQRSLFGREGKATLYEGMPLFEMAGEKAIGADKGALAQAQKMLAEGVDKKEVWKETGWLKGAEGKDTWKFEIDDSGAKFNSKTLRERTKGLGINKELSEVLKHDELYKNYPQLKETLVSIEVDFDSAGGAGSYTPGENRGSDGFFDLKPIIEIKANSIKEIKSILLHEIGHAIQDIENFARGGNPQPLIEGSPGTEDYIKNAYEKVLEIWEKNFKGKASKPGRGQKVASIIDEAKYGKMEVAERKAAKFLKYDEYQRLAGEIESRDTEDRADLTAEQRREKFPYGSQGIPESDWIVVDGSGTSFSVSVGKGNRQLPKKINESAPLKKGSSFGEHYEIWNKYASAMERRRPDSVLDSDRFSNYLENYAKIFKYKNSYIIGQEKKGIFKPSHFAPNSMREGLEAIKELGKYNNIVFAVTSDLAPMLEQSGYYISSDTTMPSFFAGKIENKIIAASTPELLSEVKYAIQEFKKTGETPAGVLDLIAEQKEDDLYIKQDMLEGILFETKELDPFATSPDKVAETVSEIINNLRKSKLGRRFSSEVVSVKDMNLWHKALETPYVLAKKFPAMEKALRTEIRRHECRSQKMFDYYHGDLDKLQTDMRKHPKDLKALEDLTWEWEDQRMPEDEVPTDWHSVQEKIEKGETYGDLIINPEHYAEVKKFLLKQGHKENVVDGFITRRKVLDEILIEADEKMRSSNVDLTDLQEFRAYIGKTNNYFPHVREGDSYIRVYDKNTKKVVYREHFYKLKERFLKPENKARQRTKRWVKEQIKSGRLAGKESDYQVGLARTVEKLPDEVYFQIPVEALDQLSKQGGRVLAAEKVSREAKRLIKIEGLSEKDAHEKAYKLLTADMEKALAKAFSDVLKTRGWGSHAIKRMGVEGYKKDDTFATMFQYLSGYAGFSTKMDAVKEHHKTLHDIDAKSKPKLYKYTSDYIRDMTANADKVDNVVDKVRAALFVKFLGGVIKSGLVNLTQNVVMAAPVLSQYTKKSHRKLAKAMYDTRKAVTGKDAWLGKETDYEGIPANELRALHEMVESGAAQDLFLRELKGRVPTSGMGAMVNKVLNKAGIFMQIAEKFNRASTGLAAYRIAMNEGAVYDGKSTKNNHDLSVKFAKKAIYDSHFLYGKSNLPAAFRGGDFRKVAKAAYTFRSFTHNYLDIMSDMLLNQGTAGKKVVARSLMNIFAVGGLVSIPFFKAFSEMLKYVTDDDDEDLLTQLRAKMPNKFMKDLLVYGIPGATMGVDVSGSLSIEVPRNFKDIIGVPYSFGQDTVNMVKSVKAGNMYRAVAETPFTPIVIRNAMRGIDLYARGQTTRAGKEISAPGEKGARKITGFEAIKKSIGGLQPVSVSSGYKAYRASTKMKQGITKRKRALVDRFINARRRGDGKELQEIRREINVWNKKAYHEKKPWRVIDVDKMIEYRLKDKGLRNFPKRMRGQAKDIYETWQQ